MRETDKGETFIAAGIALLAEGVAVTLFLACVLVWLAVWGTAQ